MRKFAMIGAGSRVFTRNLVRDLLTYAAFQDAEFALMDTDEEKLVDSAREIEMIVAESRQPAKVIATTSRAEALEGADGVLCTICVGGIEVWGPDTTIPLKYGVEICIGDTRSVSGIFRALRTIPVMLDICHDIEKYCPNAIFLNYTNPMSMLCRAMQSETKVNVVGLCHSVQGTAGKLMEWIGAKPEEISYVCAGINHQAWYIEFKKNGEDAYPLIREALKNPEIYKLEVVRNEMFKHLGYYVAEGSEHNSEYNAWFRKRPELIEKYSANGSGENKGRMTERVKVATGAKWGQEDPKKIRLRFEYASHIFNAMFGDGTVYKFNGNVLNNGLIDNIAQGACVEVPMVASRDRLEAIRVGPLPEHLALINDINARVENMAVEGALTGNIDKIYQACYYDPLVSAVLSLAEIREMVDEMFVVNREFLPQFHKL